MVSPWFYTEVTAQAGISVPLDPDHEERAIYLVDGEVEIAGERYEGPRLLIFRPGDRITVKAMRPTRMMFLGGDALEGPRHIWWNFVSSSKERIEQAKQDWKTGRFAACSAGARVHSAAGVSYPCASHLRRLRPREAACLESLTDERDARQRPAPATDRARQGARYLCRRRRPRAAAHHRPHQRLRRRDGRDHPDEGRGADPDQRLVVPPARRRGAASHDQRRCRRDHRARCRR